MPLGVIKDMFTDYIKEIARLFNEADNWRPLNSLERKSAFETLYAYLDATEGTDYGLACGCGWKDGYCGGENIFYWKFNGTDYATDGNDVWINDEKISLDLLRRK